MALWGILWRSNCKLDGKREYLMHDERNNGLPYLFKSQKDALSTIKSRWEYVAKRKDLRSEPHGWRMPIPIRVTISLAYKTADERR